MNKLKPTELQTKHLENINELYEKKLKIYKEQFYKIEKNDSINFWDEIKNKSIKFIDKTFDDFLNFNDKRCKENSLFKNDEINVFKIHINKIKKEMIENFLEMEKANKNLDDYIDKQNILYKQINNIEELDKIISKETSIILKNMIIDISNELLNENYAKQLLDIYNKFYIKHLNYVNQLKSINCLNNKPICNICIQNEINTVLLPCGHTFCNNCTNIMSRCGLCREPINNIKKIFI